YKRTTASAIRASRQGNHKGFHRYESLSRSGHAGCPDFRALLACPRHGGFLFALGTSAIPETATSGNARSSAAVRDHRIAQPRKGRCRPLLHAHRKPVAETDRKSVGEGK